MREILENFEKEEAYKLSAEKKVKTIVKALQDARLEYVAYKIEKACSAESDYWLIDWLIFFNVN